MEEDKDLDREEIAVEPAALVETEEKVEMLRELKDVSVLEMNKFVFRLILILYFYIINTPSPVSLQTN